MKQPTHTDKEQNLPSLTLITGGARSGKSRHAQELARSWGGDDVVFIATAEAYDDSEFLSRIERHRESRPEHWVTVEEPRDVSQVISGYGYSHAVILVDCLTLLVTNWMFRELEAETGGFPESRPLEPHQVRVMETRLKRVLREVEQLAEQARAVPASVIVVTNEVGQGIVPASPVARYFRDTLGSANQVVAARADRVDWLVSGIPVTIKPQPGPHLVQPVRKHQGRSQSADGDRFFD